MKKNRHFIIFYLLLFFFSSNALSYQIDISKKYDSIFNSKVLGNEDINNYQQAYKVLDEYLGLYALLIYVEFSFPYYFQRN